MRIRDSSIPAGDRPGIPDTGRGVTVENLFSVVSLLRSCGLGSLILGPTSRAATPPPPTSKGGEGLKTGWSRRQEERRRPKGL